MFSFARWQNCCAVRLKICKFADSDSTVFIANSATVLPSCEWKHVAAYYFSRTINCHVDLRRLYAKVYETWHYYGATICA